MALRCLIVDDSEEFLASAGRLLASQGMQIVGRATSSAEALELVTVFSPDVALVDIMLGEEDGFELARKLATAARPTRVVLISTHEREELEVQELIRSSSAVGFVPKSGLSAKAIVDALDS